jgi:U3 small nucleolar RNA-associated protein 18
MPPGKYNRKRQRVDKGIHLDSQPLGAVVSLVDDAEKDDEERRLENVLFGKPFFSTTKDDSASEGSEGDDTQDYGGHEFENLLDSDVSGVCLYYDFSFTVVQLFVLDQPATSVPESNLDSGALPDQEVDSEIENDQQMSLQTKRAATKKAPAWIDPDDTAIQVSLASNKRLRKLRDTASEDTVGGRDYERRLRRQYEKINPMPEWASNARKKLKTKRRRSSPTSGEDEEELFTSTGGILADGRKQKSRIIPSGVISIERLRDANISAKAEGDVKAVQFHPSSQVPIIFAASADRRLRLFNVSLGCLPAITS